MFRCIQDKYWEVVPYEYRPGQLWYKFKCFIFHRYTTVKPRTLPHTWCDKSALIPHVLFEMLCDFVETELRNGPVNWDSDPEHAAARDKMEALYKWWTEEYDGYYPWNESNIDNMKPGEVFELENKYHQELLSKCKEVIDLSPWMWT